MLTFLIGKMNKKSQAAIEFLMTYGWAILGIVVAIGALTSFGVLDPLIYFTENRCRIYGNFYCTDFKVDGSNQQVVLVLRNGLGFDAKDVAVKLNSNSCTDDKAELKPKGAARAANDIKVSGSNNTLNGGTLYGTTFTSSGSGNFYNPAPQQSTQSIPQAFNIEDYKQGGSAAIKAQAEGKYAYIDGDFKASDSGAVLNGLYYATADAKFSGSIISGTFTIVAEGKIDVSGSGQNFVSYVDGLLFFSNAAGNDAIKVAGSDSSFEGDFYAPNGEIRESGSNNQVNGFLLGSQIGLSGSGLTITYAPVDTAWLRAGNNVPNPWYNGQTVRLNFTCLGKLQKKFEGKVEVDWYTKYTWQTQYAGHHAAVGIIKSKIE